MLKKYKNSNLIKITPLTNNIRYIIIQYKYILLNIILQNALISIIRQKYS